LNLDDTELAALPSGVIALMQIFSACDEIPVYVDNPGKGPWKLADRDGDGKEPCPP
jgi:hypothetical protein